MASPASTPVIVHDYLLAPGGAERLVLMLAHELGATLVTAFETDVSRLTVSESVRLRALGPPRASILARYLATIRRFQRIEPAMLLADNVVYSGVISPLAAHRQPRGRRIHYCHSPPRFFYDLREYYRERSGPMERFGLELLEWYLRPRYEQAIRDMDVVVANSENVRKRLHEYLGIDAVVVPPPIDIERFRWLGQGDYYLSVARLEPLKRVSLLVDAFRSMPDRKLVVASGGSQLAVLRERAQGAHNIRFTSWLSESAMAELLGRAIATLYIPLDEDFGMSPVESMAAGKPVIGVAEGGLLETVVNNQTGLLLQGEPTVEAVVSAVLELDEKRAGLMRAACEERASLFSRQRFVERMRALI